MEENKKTNMLKRCINNIKQTKLHYYLHKTISPKNTYLVGIVVIGLFILISYFSYAMFTVYEEHERVLTMQAGTLSLNITSSDLNNNSITLEAGETEIIEIEVANNSLTKVKGDLNYTTTNNDVVVKYLDELNGIMPDANGNFIINASTTKKAVIALYNNSAQTGTVTFSKDFGLENATLTGHNTVITNTIDDPYKMINLNNTFANKIYSDNSIVKSLKVVPNGFDNTKESDGLYRYKDEEGTSTYFFRGEDPNNYVTFAGSTWRILRIQEDGTVKLIKDDALNFESDKVKSSEPNYKKVAYSSPNYNVSNVEAYIDEWYQSEMAAYDNKVVVNDYCDRQTDIDYSQIDMYYESGLAINEAADIAYGVYDRLSIEGWDSEALPTNTQLKSGLVNVLISCSNNSDGHKTSSKTSLITGDEYVLAGGGLLYSTNTFLSKQYTWWTMSLVTITADVDALILDSTGDATYHMDSLAVHPVITLKADISNITGNGTSSSPYVIN